MNKMQTFLPHLSYIASAGVLDNRRLGKQRVEVLQILRALNNKTLGKSSGWQHHPCTLMWQGYEDCLIRYGLAICNEWMGRGYKDTCTEKIMAFSQVYPLGTPRIPVWLTDDFMHMHRGLLYRKAPRLYNAYEQYAHIPFTWPVSEDKS